MDDDCPEIGLTPKVGIGMEVGGANGFTPADFDAPPLPPKH